MKQAPRTLLAWSSGKDSAYSLHVLRAAAARDPCAPHVVALLTTVNATHDRVAMHAVRRELLMAQASRRWDHALIDALPPSADPCGENGEFHTFVSAGPMFSRPIAVQAGQVVSRDGFVFADLLPA